MCSIDIFIADDHPLIIDGIVALFKYYENLNIVGSAEDGESCLEWINNNKCDLLIVDFNMPKADGIEVLKKIREKGFDFKIIMLTSYDTYQLIEEFFQFGGNGFVSKMSCTKIIEAIKKTIEGQKGVVYVHDIELNTKYKYL